MALDHINFPVLGYKIQDALLPSDVRFLARALAQQMTCTSASKPYLSLLDVVAQRYSHLRKAHSALCLLELRRWQVRLLHGISHTFLFPQRVL